VKGRAKQDRVCLGAFRYLKKSAHCRALAKCVFDVAEGPGAKRRSKYIEGVNRVSVGTLSAEGGYATVALFAKHLFLASERILNAKDFSPHIFPCQ
jgi:hypothetical protein